MELSFREWMIIIGVLLIVAVLLDGYRRVRNERRNRIRVTLSKQARARVHEPEPPEVVVDAGPNPELPNGGARVIPKVRNSNEGGRNPDLRLDQAVPVLMESVHLAPEPPKPEPMIAAVDHVEDEPEFLADDGVESHVDAAPAAVRSNTRIEPQLGDALDEAAVEPEPSAAFEERVFEERSFEEPETQQPMAAAVPEETPAEKRSFFNRQTVQAPSSAADEKPNSAAQEVLIVNVLSKNAAGFKGQDVLQILLACDMRFGNMNIFHRYEKANGKGPVQFSVANLVEPGTFDLDRIDGFSTPGLCFFLTLPGPDKAVTAFNYMIETAQVLVKNLQGELRDEAHSVMTQQTIEHCRQRIRDFERKQLTLHL